MGQSPTSRKTKGKIEVSPSGKIVLGEHLQAGRITRERETQRLRSAWSRSPARCRSWSAWKPRACELHSGSANEDRVRLPSAMPDAPPLRPREGGRSRSSARGESGRKNFLFLVEIFLER